MNSNYAIMHFYLYQSQLSKIWTISCVHICHVLPYLQPNNKIISQITLLIAIHVFFVTNTKIIAKKPISHSFVFLVHHSKSNSKKELVAIDTDVCNFNCRYGSEYMGVNWGQNDTATYILKAIADWRVWRENKMAASITSAA